MSSASLMNETFIRSLDTQEGVEKTSALGSDYIRDRLRETSFVEKVLTEKKVDKGDPNMSISVEHDTLGYLCEIQPNSRAMPITMRGEPTGELVQGKRFMIAFYGISTAEYQAHELEMMAYTMPIINIIQQQASADIGDIRDRDFIIHVEAAVQAMQNTVVGNVGVKFNTNTLVAGTTTEVSIFKGQLAWAAYDSGDPTVGESMDTYPIHRNDIFKFDQMLGADGGDRQLQLAMLLMNTTDADDVMRWTLEDLGDQMTNEMVTTGWKRNSLFGWKIIRTIKSRILRRGVMYGFTAEEFIGKFLRLRPLKFEAKKEFDRIKWKSWEFVGMGIGNVASIIKWEGFPGSVKPGWTDTGFAAHVPQSYDDMFAATHKVEEGLIEPNIAQF